MGNLYRFVEPVVLFLLKKKGRSYGYELAAELREHALTDASIEAAALYKTLRQLEQNDCVTSEWDVTGKGPAKRVYCLTSRGEEHLAEWTTVLDHVARSMTRSCAQPESRLATSRHADLRSLSAPGSEPPKQRSRRLPSPGNPKQALTENLQAPTGRQRMDAMRMGAGSV